MLQHRRMNGLQNNSQFHRDPLDDLIVVHRNDVSIVIDDQIIVDRGIILPYCLEMKTGFQVQTQDHSKYELGNCHYLPKNLNQVSSLVEFPNLLHQYRCFLNILMTVDLYSIYGHIRLSYHHFGLCNRWRLLNSLWHSV